MDIENASYTIDQGSALTVPFGSGEWADLCYGQLSNIRIDYFRLVAESSIFPVSLCAMEVSLSAPPGQYNAWEAAVLGWSHYTNLFAPSERQFEWDPPYFVIQNFPCIIRTPIGGSGPGVYCFLGVPILKFYSLIKGEDKYHPMHWFCIVGQSNMVGGSLADAFETYKIYARSLYSISFVTYGIPPDDPVDAYNAGANDATSNLLRPFHHSFLGGNYDAIDPCDPPVNAHPNILNYYQGYCANI